MADVREQVADIPFWWHSIDLGDGVITPGHKTPQILAQEWERLELQDLHDKSVLDIGAWDGWFSFEAERRGASRVVALDYRNDEAQAGFHLAHRVLESSVELVSADFMTMDLATLGTFDVVLFLGVLYHLREPILGLERAAAVTHGLVVIETEAIAIGGRPAAAECEFYESSELAGDPTNWWAPSSAALAGMCRVAGFRDVRQLVPPPEPTSPGDVQHFRAMVQARHP